MDDAIEEIKTLLENGMGADISTYYLGEVKNGAIPKSNLPALMIIPQKTTTVQKGTAKNQDIYEILIRVVVSVAEEFTEDGTGDTIKVQQTLRYLMEKRTNNVPNSDTVLGILERNLRTAAFLYHTDRVITYSTLADGGFPYVTADCSVTATSDQRLRE